MATGTVAFILDNTCGRIAHTIERTEEILTTRTPEEDSKEEAKEEDSKAEDSKDVDSKQAGLTKIRVAASQEEAEETTSTSKDMEEVIAAPLEPIKQDSQAGIVITTRDNTTSRCTTVHNMIRDHTSQNKSGTVNQIGLMMKYSQQNH